MDFIFWSKLILSGGLIAVAVLAYLWRLRRKADFERSLDFVFLNVTIPKKDSKDDMERDRDQVSEVRKVVSIGEDFLASLQGIYSSDFDRHWKNQDFLSLEYVAVDGQIHFYMGCPRALKDLIEKQITSFYSEAIVTEISAPTIFKEGTHQVAAHISASKSFTWPFKTYTKFENTDPINNVLNTLSQASDENGNAAAIQIMIRPSTSNWQGKVRDEAKSLASGKSKIAWWNPLSILGGMFQIMVRGTGEDNQSSGEDGKETNESQDMTKAMEEKAEKVGFHAILRCVSSSPNARMAETNLKNIVTAFAQYGTPTLNNFTVTKYTSSRAVIRNFVWRSFRHPLKPHKKLMLSTEELASMFHFPHIKYNNVPSVKWQNYKIVQAPNNIPKKACCWGIICTADRTRLFIWSAMIGSVTFMWLGKRGRGNHQFFKAWFGKICGMVMACVW